MITCVTISYTTMLFKFITYLTFLFSCHFIIIFYLMKKKIVDVGNHWSVQSFSDCRYNGCGGLSLTFYILHKYLLI